MQVTSKSLNGGHKDLGAAIKSSAAKPAAEMKAVQQLASQEDAAKVNSKQTIELVTVAPVVIESDKSDVSVAIFESAKDAVSDAVSSTATSFVSAASSAKDAVSDAASSAVAFFASFLSSNSDSETLALPSEPAQASQDSAVALVANTTEVKNETSFFESAMNALSSTGNSAIAYADSLFRKAPETEKNETVMLLTDSQYSVDNSHSLVAFSSDENVTL